MRRFSVLAAAILYVAFICTSARAGSSQAGGEMHFKAEQVMAFAKKVEKSLAEKGAVVAIVARVGRPRNKLPPGVGYTHTAFAVYSQINTADGRKIPGYATYNLYQSTKQPNTSYLMQDFPADFFSGVEVLEAGIIIPSPQLQWRILKVITSGTYKELHNPHYSVIANPFTLGCQNCTEYVLDAIFAAIYETNNIRQIKKNEETYFEAQLVNVNPIKLALGSLFTAEITTSDHPGAPVIATFETISKFIEKYDRGSEAYVIVADN